MVQLSVKEEWSGAVIVCALMQFLVSGVMGNNTALMAVTRLGVNVSTLYVHVDKL